MLASFHEPTISIHSIPLISHDPTLFGERVLGGRIVSAESSLRSRYYQSWRKWRSRGRLFRGRPLRNMRPCCRNRPYSWIRLRPRLEDRWSSAAWNKRASRRRRVSIARARRRHSGTAPSQASRRSSRAPAPASAAVVSELELHAATDSRSPTRTKGELRMRTTSATARA